MADGTGSNGSGRVLITPTLRVGRDALRRRWAAVLLLSVLLAGCGEAVRLPASLLLGPMAAAIVLGVAGRPIAVPGVLFSPAQAVIGCPMARALPTAIVARLAQDWLRSGAAILSVVMASAGRGLALTRMRILPGTTAI